MPNPVAQIQIPFPPSVNSYWHKAVILPKSWGRVIRRVVPAGIWKRVGRMFIGRRPWPVVRVFVGSQGKTYRQQVLEIVRGCGLNRATAARLKVEVKVYMPDRRTHDLDNLGKAPLDALTAAHVWVDDKQIDDLHWIRGPIRPPGCLIVRIEKLPVPVQADLF